MLIYYLVCQFHRLAPSLPHSQPFSEVASSGFPGLRLCVCCVLCVCLWQVTQVQFRLQGGGTIARRFWLNDRVSLLFQFLQTVVRERERGEGKKLERKRNWPAGRDVCVDTLIAMSHRTSFPLTVPPFETIRARRSYPNRTWGLRISVQFEHNISHQSHTHTYIRGRK